MPALIQQFVEYFSLIGGPVFSLNATLVALAMAAVSLVAQTPATGGSSSQTARAAERVMVYHGGTDVKIPILLASQKPFAATNKCHNKQQATVTLSLVVDSLGSPRNIFFEHPAGNELDELALLLAESDRFEPGSYTSVPVAIGGTLQIQMQACVEKGKDVSGHKITTLRLEAQPRQEFEDAPDPQQETMLAPINTPQQISNHLERVGGDVTPPKAILQPEAQFSDYARRAKIEGTCVLGLVVDAHGMPQNVHITRSLEASLDEQAIFAVQHYRFRPAMRSGAPVPVTVAVEVRFRLYH